MKKPAQEFTSKEVASMAGRVLKRVSKLPSGLGLWVAKRNRNYAMTLTVIGTTTELKAICASALTQARNRKTFGDDIAKALAVAEKMKRKGFPVHISEPRKKRGGAR